MYEQKGYTPSYNGTLLFNTLEKIKNNEEVTIPMYSQDISNIHSTKKLKFGKDFDILIIEGINLLKTSLGGLAQRTAKRSPEPSATRSKRLS